MCLFVADPPWLFFLKQSSCGQICNEVAGIGGKNIFKTPVTRPQFDPVVDTESQKGFATRMEFKGVLAAAHAGQIEEVSRGVGNLQFGDHPGK